MRSVSKSAGTIVWNGPLGVFENPEFAAGTRRVAEAIAASKAFSIAGGGDTLAAIEQFGVGDRISYISTGGGAFLEFLEGKKLPAVATLEQRAAGGLTVPQVSARARVARAGVRRRRRRPPRRPFACRRRSRVFRAGPRSCSAPARPPRRWRPRSMRTGARPCAAWSSRATVTVLKPGEERGGIEIVEAGHPSPDAASLAAGARLLELAAELQRRRDARAA